MSTKKENKKPTAKTPIVKAEPTKPAMPKEGVWEKQEDGTFKKVDPTELLRHNTSLITVTHGDDEPKTFGIEWQKDDHGNYLFRILTSHVLIDEHEEINGSDVTLVGRGDSGHAWFALTNAWAAFASQFGLEKAYRLVRMSLGYKTKMWSAVFAPCTDILGF